MVKRREMVGDARPTCPALLWFMCPWQFLQIAPGRTSSTFFIGPFASFFTSSFTFSCFIFTSFLGRPLADRLTGTSASDSLSESEPLDDPLDEELSVSDLSPSDPRCMSLVVKPL